MNEWAVLGVIITVVTFLIAICKPLISLTNAITQLTVAVGNLEKRSEAQEKNANQSHKELWAHNSEQDDKIEANRIKIAEHEIKIKNLKGGGS